MNTVLFVILTLIGVTYCIIAAISTAVTICPLKNPDGSYVPDDVEMKRFLLAMLLLPISPIIGPYFIYKVLKKGSKK